MRSAPPASPLWAALLPCCLPAAVRRRAAAPLTAPDGLIPAEPRPASPPLLRASRVPCHHHHPHAGLVPPELPQQAAAAPAHALAHLQHAAQHELHAGGRRRRTGEACPALSLPAPQRSLLQPTANALPPRAGQGWTWSGVHEGTLVASPFAVSHTPPWCARQVLRRVLFIQWMAGGDARTLIDQAMRPMDEAAAATIILPIAQALQAAHKCVRSFACVFGSAGPPLDSAVCARVRW